MIRNQSIDIGMPYPGEVRLIGFLFREPPTMLCHDRTLAYCRGYLGLKLGFPELVGDFHPLPFQQTQSSSIFRVNLEQGVRI